MRELEKKQKADEEGGTVTNNHSGLNSSGNSGPHSLIQHTSSSNSNHNNSNIHSASGKRLSSFGSFRSSRSHNLRSFVRPVSV